jgi:hypothetical protein
MAAGFSSALRNARADAITTLAGNAAILEIYSGERPATGGSEGTLLVSFTLDTPFAASASGGVLTVNLPDDATAGATGTASWARIYAANGTTIVMDLGVGTSGQEITLNTTSIVSGISVSITAITITEGNA